MDWTQIMHYNSLYHSIILFGCAATLHAVLWRKNNGRTGEIRRMKREKRERERDRDREREREREKERETERERERESERKRERERNQIELRPPLGIETLPMHTTNIHNYIP